MHCGEQGIVVEILDDTWVLLIQCNGHIDKTSVNDIWLATSAKQNGKEALHEFFIKTLGYSSIYDDKLSERGPLSPEELMPLASDERGIPF